MEAPARRTSLSREDWTDAALRALADEGPAGVAVERLAARLGATKGSFYWHFANREELISAALAAWERRDTDEAIEELRSIEDPVDRLRVATARAMEYDEEETPDVRLLPARSDSAIAEVVERVQRKRLDFLAQLFREAGFPQAEARVRARLAYSLALGWHHQQLVESSDGAARRQRRAYQQRAVELLITPGE